MMTRNYLILRDIPIAERVSTPRVRSSRQSLDLKAQARAQQEDVSLSRNNLTKGNFLKCQMIVLIV
jgi:hypothetical protein